MTVKLCNALVFISRILFFARKKSSLKLVDYKRLSKSKDGKFCFSKYKKHFNVKCIVTDVVGQKDGIKEINVSLEAKEAKVSYSTTEVTANQIAKYIEDMGFDAFVKESNEHHTTPASKAHNAGMRNGDVVPHANGGGDVALDMQNSAKCFLHIRVSLLFENFNRKITFFLFVLFYQ